MAEPGFWQYTVVGTPCRRSSAEIEFRHWLEGESRRSSLRKFARARHSVRKQVDPRFKNGPLLKRQILTFKLAC